MAEIGYGGSVGEAGWSTLAPHLGVEYSVEGASDWAVTSVPLSDRTVSIAAGTGAGKGIVDVTTTPVQLTLSSVGSGFRWDMVVRHRDTAGTGGTSSFTLIEGTSDPLAVFGSRSLFGSASTEDDQPIALVRVDAGSALITAIRDVRVWQANGGAVALDDAVMQYLTKIGTLVKVGSVYYQRVIDSAGNAPWARTHVDPNMVYDGPLAQWVPRSLAGVGFVVLDAGTGTNQITLDKTLPRGDFYTLVMMNGDASSQPGLKVYGQQFPHGASATNIATFHYEGALAGNSRINWLATYNRS